MNSRFIVKTSAVFTLLTVLLISLSTTALSPPEPDSQKFLGNIYSSTQLTDFTSYWQQVTPENAGKWGSVEALRDVMNWSELDAAYALAKDNDLPFKMHVMVWGSQQPSWIDNLTETEKLAEIEQWYALVAARYNDIDYLEVVNEPLHAPPNGQNKAFSTTPAADYAGALGGDGVTGYDWIIKSFELARFYFPSSKLLINEYGIINSVSNTDKYITIINLLTDRDLIDAIGFQAHAFSTTATVADMKANLDKLAATGLDIYVTELDIDGIDDAVQLAEYKRVFPLFWQHDSVRGITLWGWRPGLWRDEQGAYLIDSEGNERPALVWLKDYITLDMSGLFSVPEVTANQVFSVSEDLVEYGEVGIALATEEQDNIDSFSFVGNAGPFSIDENGKIILAAGQSLDYETSSSYNLWIAAANENGQGSSAEITINVTDVDETTPTTTPTTTTPTNSGSQSSGGSIPWLFSLMLMAVFAIRGKKHP